MSKARRGSVLIVVTVVLLVVSLAVVGLLSMVRLDLQATKMRGRELVMENALQIAESHVIAIAQMSREHRYAGGNLTRSPELFAERPVFPDLAENGPVLFSVVIPSHPQNYESHSFGLVNESTKLNLFQLLEWEQQIPGAGEQALLELPGMQSEQAAAIMDWIDGDSVPRLQGGEAEQYHSEQRDILPANEVPAHLEALVHVRQTLLNDWFDDMSQPPAKSDALNGRPKGSSDRSRRESETKGNVPASFGSHQAWEHFLTVHSRERNQSFSGEPRIDLNLNDISALHELLAERVNTSLADFVVMYRQFGPGRGGRLMPLSAVRIDFSLPGKFKFTSELELVGATVSIPGGRSTWQRFDSPLGGNRSGWAGQLEYLMDQITVDTRTVIEGRINIDEAPREVLLAIPGMDPTTADRILAARFLSADGRVAHVHPTWILEQGIVDLPRMKHLLKYCTTGGDVFQANIIAYIPQTTSFLHEIVAIDGAEKMPVKLYCKDRRDTPNPYRMEK